MLLICQWCPWPWPWPSKATFTEHKQSHVLSSALQKMKDLHPHPLSSRRGVLMMGTIVT